MSFIFYDLWIRKLIVITETLIYIFIALID